MSFEDLVVSSFLSFSAGFALGFFYLKHKFEDKVAGILDFSGENQTDIGDLVDGMDLEEVKNN